LSEMLDHWEQDGLVSVEHADAVRKFLAGGPSG
jgi:hypothetical protein